MIVITIIIVVLFLIYIGWTWNSLYNYEIKNKVIYMFFITIIMALVTFILFNISKSGIEYLNTDMMKDVRNVLILFFTPINGMIIGPYFAKQLCNLKEDLDYKEKFKKKIIIMLILFMIILILECVYMKDIQLGILNIVKKI